MSVNSMCPECIMTFWGRNWTKGSLFYKWYWKNWNVYMERNLTAQKLAEN